MTAITSEIDPDFALQTRLTFGRRTLYLWAIVGAGLAIFVLTPAQDVGTAVTWYSRFLTTVALPYGAIQLLSLERNGQLDLRRLAGRSPLQLGLALIGGGSWILLACGTALDLAATVAGSGGAPAMNVSLMLAGGAVACVLLKLPRLGPIDHRLILTLVALTAGAAAGVVSMFGGIAPVILLVAAAVTAITLPSLIGDLKRPPGSRPGPRRSDIRGPALLRHTRLAEFTRIRLTSVLTRWLAVDVLAMIALTTWVMRSATEYSREALALLLVYSPLILGAYAASSRARLERSSGALDRLTLTGQRPVSAVVQMAAATSLPFIVLSLAAVFTWTVFDARSAKESVVIWPLVAVMWAFGGLTEGLQRRVPGMYVAILVPFAGLMAVERAHTGWIPFGAAACLAAVVASGSLDRDGAPPLRGTTAIAGTMLLAAILAPFSGPVCQGLMLAGFLSVASGLILPSGARAPYRTAVGCAAAAALASAVAAWYWPSGFSTRVEIHFFRSGQSYAWPAQGSLAAYAVLVSASAGVALSFASVAHNQYGRTARRSLVARAIPLAIACAVTAIAEMPDVDAGIESFMLKTGYNPFAIAELGLLGLLLGVTTVLGLREWQLTRGRVPA